MVPDAAVTIMKSGVIRTIKIELFTVFSTFYMDQIGKIRRRHWKKRLKISKSAKTRHESRKVFIEHELQVARIQFQTHSRTLGIVGSFLTIIKRS